MRRKIGHITLDISGQPNPRTPPCGIHPGGNPGANLKSISHRCHPILMAFALVLTTATLHLPLSCRQIGVDTLPPVETKRGKSSIWPTMILAHVEGLASISLCKRSGESALIHSVACAYRGT